MYNCCKSHVHIFSGLTRDKTLALSKILSNPNMYMPPFSVESVCVNSYFISFNFVRILLDLWYCRGFGCVLVYTDFLTSGIRVGVGFEIRGKIGELRMVKNV